MKKIIKVNEVGIIKEIPTDYNYGDKRTDINVLISYLNKSKDKGATHIQFSGRTDYDSCYDLEELTFEPVSVVEESDEDFEKRKTELKERKERERIQNIEQQKKNELFLLKHLKEKYENN